eukprot:1159095-Pelagomonas_calceolata.AAC.11
MGSSTPEFMHGCMHTHQHVAHCNKSRSLASACSLHGCMCLGRQEGSLGLNLSWPHVSPYAWAPCQGKHPYSEQGSEAYVFLLNLGSWRSAPEVVRLKHVCCAHIVRWACSPGVCRPWHHLELNGCALAPLMLLHAMAVHRAFRHARLRCAHVGAGKGVLGLTTVGSQKGAIFKSKATVLTMKSVCCSRRFAM